MGMKQKLLNLGILSFLILAACLCLLPTPVEAMTGTGTLLDPYIIEDVNDLQIVTATNPQAYFELGSNIDASATIGWNAGAGFEPLGKQNGPSVIRRPTGDESSIGAWTVFPAVPGTMFDKVDEVIADDDATYISVNAATWPYTRVMFSFIPIVLDPLWHDMIVTVTARGTSGNYNCYLKVGGVYYPNTLGIHFHTVGYYTWDKEWVVNPATNLPWTIADIEGTGPNPLQAFGIDCGDAGSRVTQIYMKVHLGNNFSGSIDGKGYKISDLYINRPLEYSIGLFSEVLNATFQNLEMEDSIMFGDDIGTLVAWDDGGCIYESITITNPTITGGAAGGMIGMQFPDLAGNASSVHDCHVVGGIITTNGFNDGGGLIGWWSNGEISDSDSTAEIIEGDNGHGTLGGFIGWVGAYDGPTYIHDCYSTGDVNTLLETFGLIGGFIGWIDGGKFERCYATGDVKCPLGSEVGGFTTYIWDADVDDCYCTGDVYAEEDVGGFCESVDCSWGYALQVTLDRCYAAGDIYVTANAGGSGVSYVGGFVSYNQAGIFQECFCTGDIIIDNTVDLSIDMIGGFAAGNWGGYVESLAEMRNCYSRSSIQIIGGTVIPEYLAGFCAQNTGSNPTSPATIDKCYSTGIVPIVGINSGGFCADNYDGFPADEGIITDCFWDEQTSGWITSAGIPTPKTTVEMKVLTTFPTWDFILIWNINPSCNDGYPCLLNTTPSCPLTPVYGAELSFTTLKATSFPPIITLGSSNSDLKIGSALPPIVITLPLVPETITLRANIRT